MSESSYQKVFEVIQTSLVPKSLYNDLQNEVASLKSELESARNQWKLKFEEQKLAMDILKAEKESLESEKKTFETKFKEVSLKLKQKTHQLDSLLKSNETGHKETSIATSSTGTQTIKEEPTEIGIVNVPTSLSCSGLSEGPQKKIGSKRCTSVPSKDKSIIAKRNKMTKSAVHERTTGRSFQFKCKKCLANWIWDNTFGEGDDDPTDDLSQHKWISNNYFNTFEDYRNHCSTVHSDEYNDYIKNSCQEKNCPRNADHRSDLHGDIKCKICGLTFKLQKYHNLHMRFEHADIEPREYSMFQTV